MTRERALYQLILSLFNPDELRRWLRFDADASVIVPDLPGPTASLSELANAAVDRLVAHGLVDAGLFARLRDARPRRAAEIDQVEGLWRSPDQGESTDGSTAVSSRPTTAAQGSGVVQSGGFSAPGSTFNVQGGQYAGDKHEVHHHDHGVAQQAGMEPAEQPRDRARLRPGEALEITPLEPPPRANAFWPAGDPRADGPHAHLVADSGDHLVVRMHAMAFGEYVVGVQGDEYFGEDGRTEDVELRIPAAEIESIAPSLQGESFELRLSRPLRYETRTRRWVLGAPGLARPSMSPVSASPMSPTSASPMSPIAAAPRIPAAVAADAAARVRPTAEQVLTAWVHVSDIHFGHGKPSHQWNQQLITADILRDLREVLRGGALPPPRHVFVTGDVAFSGGGRRPVAGSSEYQLAATWLDQLAEVLGLDQDQVYLVPGNHDVDRGVDRADRDVRRLLQLARAGTEPLDEILQHDEDVARLRQRMAAFVDFARSYGPADREVFHGGLWWRHSVALAEGVGLRICGFNTGLLSADDEDQGKLAVSARQLAELLLPPPGDQELVVALSHHPFTGKWVSDEAAARGRLDREAAIHLFGHLHDPDSEQARHGWGTGCLRIAAGAAHAEAAKPGDPPAGHGYSVGALVASPSGELVVRIWPRRWSAKATRFVLDVDNIDEAKGYAEHRLRQRIRRQAPAADARASSRRSEAPPAPPSKPTSAGPGPQAPKPQALEPRWHAFISYTRVDLEWVTLLAENLERLGVRTFFDEWEITPGDVVNHKIEEGLRTSECGVVICSDGSFDRPFVQEEYAVLLNKAVQGRKKLIGVLHRLSDERALPGGLGIRQWIDLRGLDDENYEREVRRLADAILGRAPARPAAGEPLVTPRKLGLTPAPVSALPETSQAATEREAPSRGDVGERRRPWDAVGAITWILAAAPRWLAEALNRGLHGAQRGGEGESHAELARRVAGNIDALGAGIGAAGILLRACDDALFPKEGDPEPDAEVARDAVRELLCEWMPRRYEDGAGIERSSHAACPDLRLSTASELVAAFHVAGENELAAEIDGKRLRSKRSLEDPAALAAEMHGDDLADRIAEDVLGKKPEIARQGEETQADRRELVADRFARLHRRRKPRDLTLSSARWAKLATPEARARLKEIFAMLRQVETTASSAEEKALRGILMDIFRDDDDDDD